MNTAHLSASLSRAAGGIFEIELALAHHLEQLGVKVSALGLEDGQWKVDSARWSPVRAEVAKTLGPHAFGYSADFLPRLKGYNADLAHLHSLWMYPSVAVQRWSRQAQKPYIVTPNGMLEPWALRNSAWKKRLAGILYENRCLHSAACLQANTEKEAADFRAYGLKNPIAVIPNGVDLPEEESPGLKVESRRSGERRILLFLGRLHPKKGLVNALRAWSKIRGQGSGGRGQEEWQFVIAGWDQGGHEADLKRLCADLGLGYLDVPAAEFVGASAAERGQFAPLGTSGPARRSSPTVIFTGPAFGAAKDALLRSADAFILPSFSEGLPMSVLEAWSYRLPVLMTAHCNLPEGFAHDAAIHIDTGVRAQEAGGRGQGSGVRSQGSGIRGQLLGIDEGMRLLMEMTEAERLAMGQSGRALVEQQFTWPQVAAQMKQVYEWVLGGGEKPACVRY